MVYIVKFISMFLITYSIHILMKTIVDTFTFKIYKSKFELCAWSLYIYFVAYMAVRFRIFEDLSLAINGIISVSWMLSYFVFAKYNLKLSLKDTIKLGLFVDLCIISFDMLTALLVFEGYSILDKSLMSFLAIYVEMVPSIFFLSVALFVDKRKIDIKFAFTKKSVVKIAVIPIILSMTYYLYSNLLSYSERMSSNKFPLKLVFSNGIVVLLILWIIMYSIRLLRRKQSKLVEEIIIDYMNILETVNEDLKHYKHDIENILLGLGEYIKANDMTNLKTYFINDVKLFSPSQTLLSRALQALNPVRIDVLKGSIIRALYENEESGQNISFYCDSVEDEGFHNVEAFSLMVGGLLNEILIKQNDEDVLVSIYHDMDEMNEKRIVYEIKAVVGTSNIKLKPILTTFTEPFSRYRDIKIEAICKDDIICRAAIHM